MTEEVEAQIKVAGKLLERINKYIDPQATIAGGAPRAWKEGNLARDLDIYISAGWYSQSQSWMQDILDANVPGLKMCPCDEDSGWDVSGEILKKVVTCEYEGETVELLFIDPEEDRYKVIMGHIDTGINRLFTTQYYGEINIHTTSDYSEDIFNNTITVFLDGMTDAQIVHCLYNHLPKLQGYYPDKRVKFKSGSLKDRYRKQQKAFCFDFPEDMDYP